MVSNNFHETEIGILPNGWDVAPLSLVVKGRLSYGLNAPATSYVDTLPQYIRITDITEDGRYSKADRASVDAFPEDKYWLQEGDIVLARTGASTGKSYLYDSADGKMVYAGFLIKASVNSDKYVPKYVAAQLRTARYWSWVEKTSLRSGQPGINGKEYSAFIIPIPHFDEQQAIATALSDVDELIANLEKLIEKKKALKQGTMQALLTGKKRLPGFSGEWKSYEVGTLGDFYQGLSGKTKESFGAGNSKYIPFMNVLYNTIIDTSYLDSVDIKPGEKQNEVRIGDLFFNTSSETPEEVGMCAVLLEALEDTYLNSFCFGFRLKENKHSGLFISYLFNSSVGRKIMYLLAQGATRYNLSKSNFAKTKIILPEKEEQEAIAGILFDIDAEISTLNEKLEKYQNIKQGMMQKLLTGEIRLV